ncbi:MAG TPA: alkaline phosphatase PhoX [Polyangiaceae bacterium]
MRVKRRAFLGRSAALAAASALPFVFAGRRARAADYGPLVDDPDGILDLPSGFSYAVIDRAGDTMTDGYRVPAKPDGMACFSGSDGTLVLLRNHEISSAAGEGPYQNGQSPPAEAYDASRYGGVTRVVVDTTTRRRVSSNLVLVGTAQNCAGGPSPWGWLTCEETFDDDHGYVFVCRTGASSVSAPERVVGYGHFRHEAVAIETPSHRAYLTEDRPDSCLYRFVPDDPEAPFEGRLQALAVAGRPGFQTATGLEVGDELEVAWIDLDDPDPADDDLRQTAVSLGAAVIRRGEGIWYADGVVYFDSTSGGPADLGQIFALRPTADGGTLTLLAQSTNEATLNGPDNLVMSPWGDLIVAEDSVNGSGVHHLRGLTPEGEIYDLGRTRQSELAGVCFSPDGRALFVNVYGAGLTLVITGPFPEVDPGGDGTAGQGGEAGEAGSSQAGSSTSGAGTGTDGGSSGEAGSPNEPAGGRGGSAGLGGQSPAGQGGTSAGGAGKAAAGAPGNAGKGGAAGTGTAGLPSAGTAGAPASGAGGSAPASAEPESASDCSCRVGPGARSGGDAGLALLAGLSAALLRRTQPSDEE